MNIRVQLLLITAIIIFGGCGYRSVKSAKPDDEVSEYMCDNIGDEYIYLGTSEKYDGGVVYSFCIEPETLSKDSIDKFLDVASSLSIKEGERMNIELMTQFSGGNWGICSLKNYYKTENEGDNNEFYVFPEMSVFTISGQELSISILNEPSTFTGAKRIKYLFVSEIMQEKADEEGVDWKEIWPELEGVEVF